MNINSATSASFASAGLDLDPESRLAVLVLEQQQTQENGAREDKSLARQRYVEASNDEVEALRDKAGHILKGAWAQGAATLAGSGSQMVDAFVVGENGALEATSSFGHGAAPVLGRCLGDSPAATDDANAKRASSLAQQAQWQLDDANQVIDKADKSQDKAIDWLSSVNSNQASAETGIIAGFA